MAFDPSQLPYFDYGGDTSRADFFTPYGSLSDFMGANTNLSTMGAGGGAYRGEGGDFTRSLLDQRVADAVAGGMDPNGEYAYAGFDVGPNSYAHGTYQRQGDKWAPIDGNVVDKGYRKGMMNALQLSSLLFGPVAGFLGGGLAGTGISASSAGAATGSGLGASLGEGLSLAAPTAGATGSGLYVPALAGGAGLGAGAAAGLEGLSNYSGGGNDVFGDYSLSSAPDYSFSSGGEGLSSGDFSLGDGYSNVFDTLSSPGVSDYGTIGDFTPASFDVGGAATNTGGLLDEVKRRFMERAGQQFSSPKGLIDLARRGLGTYQQFQQANAAKRAAQGLQGQIQGLQDMFGPNSAYAQQMRQQLSRRDAAAGRRSQYGPREVELQAALAGMQSRMAPSLASMFQQQTGLNNQAGLARSQATNTALGALGGPLEYALNPLVKRGLSGLADLFGG